MTLTAADFQSVAFAPPASCPAPFSAGGTVCVPPSDTTSFAGMASARQADGSLPLLPFLRLAANSPLIDKGTNVGLPYSGSAPDLGCFETGLAFDPGDGGADGSTMGGGSSTGGASGGASSGSSGSSGSTTASGSSSSGASGGSSGGSTGSGSGPTSDADAAAETNATTGQKSGCGCELIGARHPSSRGAWAGAGLLLVGLGLGRRLRRSGESSRRGSRRPLLVRA